MDDIFTHSGASNRKRVYALSGFTVQYRVQGWYFRRTDHDEPFKGPYQQRIERSPYDCRSFFAKEIKRRDCPID